MFRYKKKLYYITNSYLSIFRLSLEGILCLKRVPSLLYLVVKNFLMMTNSSLILVASSQCLLSCVAGMMTHDHKHTKLIENKYLFWNYFWLKSFLLQVCSVLHGVTPCQEVELAQIGQLWIQTEKVKIRLNQLLAFF